MQGTISDVSRIDSSFGPDLVVSHLLAYAEGDKFPGLGIIKKLAIMHHFQLMHRLLALN